MWNISKSEQFLLCVVAVFLCIYIDYYYTLKLYANFTFPVKPLLNCEIHPTRSSLPPVRKSHCPDAMRPESLRTLSGFGCDRSDRSLGRWTCTVCPATVDSRRCRIIGVDLAGRIETVLPAPIGRYHLQFAIFYVKLPFPIVRRPEWSQDRQAAWKHQGRLVHFQGTRGRCRRNCWTDVIASPVASLCGGRNNWTDDGGGMLSGRFWK